MTTARVGVRARSGRGVVGRGAAGWRDTVGRAPVPALTLALAVLAAWPGAAHARQSAPVEVPLSLEHGRLVVPVTLPDGSTARFGLTTGAAATVLTESTAARIGAGGAPNLGTLPVPMDGAMTVPDGAGGDGPGPLDGLIAPNMLSDFDVLIDLPRGRLLLRPFGRQVAWEGVRLSEPAPLRVYHGIVLGMDVELDGHRHPAMLDLARPTVVVNASAAERLGLGAEGAAALGVGSTTFRDVPVRTRDLDVLRRWSPDGEPFALVGSAFLADCAVSLSWIHREIRTCVR